MDEFEKLMQELQNSYPDSFAQVRMIKILVNEVAHLRRLSGPKDSVEVVTTDPKAKK